MNDSLLNVRLILEITEIVSVKYALQVQGIKKHILHNTPSFYRRKGVSKQPRKDRDKAYTRLE